MKRTLSVLAFSLGCAFVGLYLIYRNSLLSWDSYILTRADPGLLLVCLASFFVFLAAPVMKLTLLARYQGVPVSWTESVLVHVASVFGAAITPSNSGGAPAIVGALQRLGIPLGRSVGVASQVFVLDLVFFAWAAPLGVAYLLLTQPLTLTGSSVAVSLLVAALALGLAMLLSLFPKRATRLLLGLGQLKLLKRFAAPLKAFARSYYRSALSYARFPWAALVSLHLLTMLSWLSSFTLLWALLALYGARQDWGTVTALLTNISVLANFVPTPGGSGFIEAVTGGATRSDSSAAVVLWRLATFYSFFLTGPLVFALLFGRSRKERPLGT